MCPGFHRPPSCLYYTALTEMFIFQMHWNLPVFIKQFDSVCLAPLICVHVYSEEVDNTSTEMCIFCIHFVFQNFLLIWTDRKNFGEALFCIIQDLYNRRTLDKLWSVCVKKSHCAVYTLFYLAVIHVKCFWNDF